MSNATNRGRRRVPGDLTLLLSDMKNPESLQRLMRLAYPDLHHVAEARFRKERPGHTWQPTALVNEACIRLIESGGPFHNRRHFFGAASRAMRRLLLDSARRRKAQKRGGHWQRVEFDPAEDIGFEQSSDLLDFNTALQLLERLQPRLSEVAELRVFGGWSFDEIAHILGIAESTARRRWTRAKIRLRKTLSTAPVKPLASRVYKRIGAIP